MTDEASYRPTVAVDFDGVIHRYSRGWQDGVIYDPPMDGTAYALVTLAKDYRLVIFTVREDLEAVWEWLREYGLDGCITEVTNAKPSASLYIDDRGLRFECWADALPRAWEILEGERAS